MKDANSALALTLHSFDSNPISWLYPRCSLWLYTLFPTKHPETFLHKALILGVYTTP